jgi:siroheme synthase-like protein
MATRPDPPPAGPAPDYPVVLSVVGRRCLVVGGGPVAARRTEGLLASGALVTVVAPQVVPAITALAGPDPGPSGTRGTVRIESRPYREGEAADYELVVTATGVDQVDRSVVSDAIAAGIPVNSAVRSVPGTLRIPSVLRDGPVTVAVSTGGSSPALARWLTRRIAACLPAEVVTVAALVDEARRDLQDAGQPTDSIEWESVLDEVVPLVEAGRIDEARSLLRHLAEPPPDTP